MPRKIILAALCLLLTTLLVGCSQSHPPKASPLIGGQVDAHHCLTAAGYQWSQLQQQCVRIFESGITLLPVNQQQTSAAFVIFSDNKSQAELFTPKSSHSILLIQQANKTSWQANKFKLIDTANNQLQLYIHNQLRYSETPNTSQ